MATHSHVWGGCYVVLLPRRLLTHHLLLSQRRVSKMFGYKYFSIIFISFLFANTVNAQSKGEWKEMPPMPSKRTEVAVTLLDGKIYVVGGFTQKGITDKVEVWDSENGRWSKLSALPIPLHHTTASAVNRKLYVRWVFFTTRDWEFHKIIKKQSNHQNS